MDQFRNFKRFIDKVDKYGMKSGIVKVVPPPEWYAPVLLKVTKLPAKFDIGATLCPTCTKPSNRYESRTQSRRSLQASTEFTQVQTWRSSGRTIYRSGGQSQMSRIINHQRKEARLAARLLQSPLPALDPHELRQRPTTGRLRRGANPDALHVVAVASKRNRKMTTMARQTLSTSPLHLPRLAQKSKSQQGAEAGPRRRILRLDLAVVSPDPRMRRSPCLLDD